METSLLCCLILMTCIGAIAAHEKSQGNFPLPDCKKTGMHLLSLLDDGVYISWKELHEWAINLKILLLEFLRYETTVVDQLCAHTETSSFSNWFYENRFNYSLPYMGGYTTRLEIIKNVSAVLELKISYVESLFEEIRAQLTDERVRVGVIYLDGTSFTYEEIRKVSSIVEQRKAADVKIFVVIVGTKLVDEVVLLSDTIVFPDMRLWTFSQYLLMAMCNHCIDGWFSLQHKASLDMLSCYKINAGIPLTPPDIALTLCSFPLHSYLATIETVEEMIFLRKKAYDVFKQSGKPDIIFNIGLRRDLSNYAKRFQWETFPGRYRPLSINHWLPGKPSRLFANNDCGVWRFTKSWTHNNNSPDVLTNITKVASSEGWADFNCEERIFSLSICETTLPRRITETLIYPTEDGTLKFQIGRAVSYLTNFVSVSANVANPKFVQFLKDNKQDFPIFDCGEDVGNGRYISYSMVCDFVDHCRNKRDELSCVYPWELNLKDKVLCTSGQRLHSSEYICDNVKDCGDGTDEDNCMADNCKSMPCHDGSCLPLQWINDGYFDCFIYKIAIPTVS